MDPAAAPPPAARGPSFRKLSFLGAPHTPHCCCLRSRSCHSCRESGRRRSAPAGSSCLLLGALSPSPAAGLNPGGRCSSAAPRSSSSPGTWLSMKSICSGSPSVEPSSLRSLGPRGSRASSEIRNESSENSSVDCKCRSAEMGEPLQSARGHRVQGLWSATKLPLPQDPWRRGGRGQLGPLVTRRFGGSS